MRKVGLPSIPCCSVSSGCDCFALSNWRNHRCWVTIHFWSVQPEVIHPTDLVLPCSGNEAQSSSLLHWCPLTVWLSVLSELWLHPHHGARHHLLEVLLSVSCVQRPEVLLKGLRVWMRCWQGISKFCILNLWCMLLLFWHWITFPETLFRLLQREENESACVSSAVGKV